MHKFPTRLATSSPKAAFSLMECIIATGVLMFGMGGLMTLNSQQFRILKSTHETTAATMSLQERVEATRIATWRQLTDPNYLIASLLATPPKSAGALGGLQEQITVAAYPDPSVATKVVVRRVDGAAPAILSAGEGLADQRLARLDLQLQWTGKDARIRTRQSSFLISNGGISLMTLPGFGSASSGVSGPAPGPSTTPTPTPSPGGPTPTPTPTATSTPTPTTSSNGNGRGNVSNPNGRK